MTLSNCKKCKRLAGFLKEVKTKYPDYFCQPVPDFSDPNARLIVLGLAPGLHGANATGRPFTGNHAGLLLYQTLHKFGFASAPKSIDMDDGLALINCQITNAVKCLPLQNKPTTEEAKTCIEQYLKHDLQALPKGAIILALGSIAHNAVLRAFSMKLSAFKFVHNVLHDLGNGYLLLDSYHCSRYNTQTKRLTEVCFTMCLNGLKSC